MGNEVVHSVPLLISIADVVGSTICDVESNNALAINIQDQHTRAFDLFFAKDVGNPTTLTTDAVEDEYFLSVTTGHGLVATNDFVLQDLVSQRGFTGQVVSIAGDNIVNIDRPLEFSYLATSTIVQERTKELNVDGSSMRQVFSVGSPLTAELDITRFMIQMITDSAIELDKFGDIAPLTRGCVMRAVNGSSYNFQNFKTNSEISHVSYDLEIYDAANPGQGVYGLNGRLTYAGQEKHGVTIRIGGGESIEFIVQDDLSGLTQFRVIAAGHMVTD